MDKPFTRDASKARPKDHEQWVLYRLEERNGKLTKVPYSPRSPETRASSTDRRTWGSLREARECLELGGFDGLGFVLTPEDPFSAADLDGCVDPETGEIEPWAQEIVEELDSYTEISPSGTGLHIFVRGELPPGRRGWGNGHGLYDQGRFFTITGRQIGERGVEDRQGALEALHARLFPAEPKPTGNGASRHAGGGFTGDDRELVEWAMRAANGEKFRRLWAGDWSGYASRSEADLALASHLAFWSGGNEARMDQLFRASGLYREKWERADYRERTFGAALARVDFYHPEGRTDEKPPEGGKPPPKPNHGGAGDAPDRFNNTDLGNARRLVARHGEDLRWCPAWGRWLVWTGKRWEADEIGKIVRHAKETVTSIYVEASAAPDEGQRKALAAHAVRSEARQRIEAMIELAKSEPGIPVTTKQLDADVMVFNCNNGTINLRTGELRPHDRHDHITKISPASFDQDATSELFERVLSKATNGDEALALFLRRWAGYCLTGDTGEEKIAFAHGPAATAKSTLLEALKATWGDYAATADFEAFLARRDAGGPRNDIARLAGKRLVISIEVDEGKRLAEGLIKMITGGDTVTARFLYREAFEFVPQFKLTLAANHAPRVRDDDEAMWRRILRVPFESVIPKEERDPGVKKALRDPETSGAAILAWAVRGCREWQREGLGVPPVVEEATREYRKGQDPLRGFLSECCILSAESWAYAGELREAYERWAKENGEQDLIKGREWGERLRIHGGVADKVAKGRRIWRGIGLLSGPEDDPAGKVAESATGEKSRKLAENPGRVAEDGSKFDNFSSKTPRKEKFPKTTPQSATPPPESDPECPHPAPGVCTYCRERELT